MNWTGGRLQRHSKANANATLKTQKQHFAKARLQQQNGRHAISPLRLSAFKMPLDQGKQTNQDLPRGVKRRKSGDPLTSEDLHSKRRRFGHDSRIHAGCLNGRPQEHPHKNEPGDAAEARARQDSDRESRKSPEAERNTLDAVKRNLLRRSDWMGLNAARPLHIEFPSAQELQNIGRRRKITVEEKTRQERAQARSKRYNAANSALTHRQAFHQSNASQVEDASIRVGPNIHHSQTTPMPSQSHKPASVLCQSQSSGSMLLDKEFPMYQQADSQGGTPRNGLPALVEPIQEARGSSIEGHLVPLDQVRDSETFDEVKTRSDTLTKQASANQPDKPRKPLHRRAANRSLAWDEAKSSSVVFGQRLLESTPSRSRRSGVESRREPGNLPATSRREVAREASKSLSSGFLSSPHEGNNESKERTRRPPSGTQTLSNESSRGVHDSRLSCVPLIRDNNQLETQQKFTLELQAEAEAEAQAQADVQAAERGKGDLQPENGAASGHQADGSSSRSYSWHAENSTDSPPNATPQGQLSRISQCSPAFDEGKFRHIAIAKVNSKRSNIRHSSQSLELGGGNKSFDASIDLLQARDRLPTPAKWRYLPQDSLMLQNSGMAEHLSSRSNQKRNDVKAHSDQEQAWMRFVTQDDQSSIADNFYTRPHPRRQDILREAQRWPKLYLGHDESLAENYELQSRSNFSPTHTIKTTANTTIHEFDPHAEARARGRISPSETDFLSHLSPMEGQLEERLFNASLYTNPARTERSYIAAPDKPLGRHENDVRSDINNSSSMEVHDRSSADSSFDDFQPYLQGTYSSPSQMSHSRTTTSETHLAARRTPLRPISNIFAKTQRSLSRPKQRPSHAGDTLYHKSADTVHATNQESSRHQWIDPPRSSDRTPLSAQKHLHTFPMNYTPINNTTKKRGQDHHTGQRPSSSYSIASQIEHDRDERRRIPHSISAYHPPATSHVPFPSTRHDVAVFPVLEPVRSSNQNHHHDILLTSTSPPLNPPTSNSYDLPPLPPPQPKPLSPENFTFKKPPPLPQTAKSTAAPWQTPHHRSSKKARKSEPFSTPMPMRKSVMSRQVQPALAFSTPRPMRRPLAGTEMALGGQSQAFVAFSTPRSVKSVLDGRG